MAHRAAYLKALGITDWRQRRELAVVPAPRPRTAPVAVPDPVGNEALVDEGVEAAMPSAAPIAEVVPAAPAAAAAPVALLREPATQTDAAAIWDTLSAEVAACTRCGLHASRNCTVFGVGNRRARWLIVGEAPGAEEDRQGEPFVGRAGRLLDAMLRAIGLDRGEVFIANILKCRPPDNRVPAPDEVAACMPYLERQIALLKPAIVLAVGGVAAQNLLQTDVSVSRLRGQVHAFGAARTPLVVTYHPAYLLRSPGEKRKAWEDLKFARRIAGAPAA